MQLTEKKYKSLKAELRIVNEQLEIALQETARAAAAGDLSENEEYATSRANSERLLARKHSLEQDLANAEVVVSDSGPRISLGSMIDVTRVDKNGNALGNTRRFTLETSGDTITAKILGVDSPLGKEILNGTDGIYFIHSNGGIHYRVEKVNDA